MATDEPTLESCQNPESFRALSMQDRNRRLAACASILFEHVHETGMTWRQMQAFFADIVTRFETAFGFELPEQLKRDKGANQYFINMGQYLLISPEVNRVFTETIVPFLRDAAGDASSKVPKCLVGSRTQLQDV